MNETVSLMKREWLLHELRQLVSASKLGLYVLLYILFEAAAHYLQIWLELGPIPAFGTHVLAIISLAGAILEGIELATGIKFKKMLTEGSDAIWEKVLSWIMKRISNEVV